MTTEQNNQAEKFRPSYLPFSTFQTFLDHLADTGVPPQIDRSVLDRMSGSAQSQMLSTLEAFGLIEDGGSVTSEFAALAKAKDEARRPLMAALIEKHYQPELALGKKRATFNQLNESLTRRSEFSSGTVTKAVRFFLQAAEFAGLELSPHWKVTKTASRPRKKSGGKKATTPQQPGTSAPTQTPSSNGSANQEVIHLKSGGTVTLSIAVDLFDLTEEDREYVIQMIDYFKSYEVITASED